MQITCIKNKWSYSCFQLIITISHLESYNCFKKNSKKLILALNNTMIVML